MRNGLPLGTLMLGRSSVKAEPSAVMPPCQAKTVILPSPPSLRSQILEECRNPEDQEGKHNDPADSHACGNMHFTIHHGVSPLLALAERRRSIRYPAGMTSIEMSGAVNMPPIIGAAMRRITSDPVPPLSNIRVGEI